MTVPDKHREYLDHLPIGQPIPFELAEMPGWEIFPFLGQLEVKHLDRPEFPEPPRAGEEGRPCNACDSADDAIVWSDDDWIVLHLGEPSAVPAQVMLIPREHFDLLDLPTSLAASMGPTLSRLAAAVESVPGVGRAHLNKWGDGGSHLHWFATGRPAGMQQLRGSCLVLWEDLLPKMTTTMWRSHLTVIAEHLTSTQ